MNKSVEAPLESQIKQIWGDDTLGRSQEAETIKSFLLRRTEERKKIGLNGSYVLNIDAPWGSGKTFFLNRFRKQLDTEEYLVCYINAWEDDHAEDPLLAVLSAINGVIQPLVPSSEKIKKQFGTFKKASGKIALSLLTNVGKTFLTRHAGDFWDEAGDIFSKSNSSLITATSTESASNATKDALVKAIDEGVDDATKNLIANFEQSKSTIASFKKNLSALLKITGEQQTSHGKLFVFVDELDRCRPTYAIAMLERIKHLFDTDGVMFIVATDTQQLQHSIKAVYGQGFDAPRYLMRFFGRQYLLKATNRGAFIKKLFAGGINKQIINVPEGAKTPEFYFEKVADNFKLSARDIEQCFEMLHDIASTWRVDSKIELALLLPLIVLHQQGSELFESVANGDLELSDRQKLSGPLGFAFGEYNHNTGKSESVRGFEYLEALVATAKVDFANRKRPPFDNTYARNWAYDRISEEIQSNQIRVSLFDGNLRFSVMMRYGEIVRSISSFTA